MSDKELMSKLDALESGADFTDPSTYTALLYGNGASDEVAAPAQPEGETAAAPAPEATPAPAPAAPAAESSAPPAAAEPPKEEPAAAGVATRDGKHVIPYSVLEEARQRALQAEARATAAASELERLKAQGATEAQQQTAMEKLLSEEEMAAIREDMPAAAEAIDKLQTAYAALAAKANAAAQAQAENDKQRQQLTEEEQRDVARAQAEEAMRGTPLLRAWRDAGGGLWSEAVAADQALAQQAEWSGKSLAERALHVQNEIARKYGIPVPAAPANPTTPPPAAKPAAPKPAAEVLPTLTDFNGGPVATADPMTGMSKGQMVDTAMGMSMEEIRRMVGLSY